MIYLCSVPSFLEKRFYFTPRSLLGQDSCYRREGRGTRVVDCGVRARGCENTLEMIGKMYQEGCRYHRRRCGGNRGCNVDPSPSLSFITAQ